MTRIGLGAAAFALAIVGASAAHAQSITTATTVELRAGPGPWYPAVVVLAPQTQVAVQGCVADYSWCDIAAGGYRGWVYAGYINYMPANGAATAPLMNWGSELRIPVVPFAVDRYWGEHYRDRRWYGDRQRYEAPPGPRFGGPPPQDRRDWERERRERERRDWQRQQAQRTPQGAPGGVPPGYVPGGVPPGSPQGGADKNP